jgi:hypothetical protein
MKRIVVAALTAVAAVSMTVVGASAAHAQQCVSFCPYSLSDASNGDNGSSIALNMATATYGADNSDQYMTPRIPPAQVWYPPSRYVGSTAYDKSTLNYSLQNSVYPDSGGSAAVAGYNPYDQVIGAFAPAWAVYSLGGHGYQENGVNVNLHVPTTADLTARYAAPDGVLVRPYGGEQTSLSWDLTTFSTDMNGTGQDNLYVSVSDSTAGTLTSEVWATSAHPGATHMSLNLNQFAGHDIHVSFEGMFSGSFVSEFDIAQLAFHGEQAVSYIS